MYCGHPNNVDRFLSIYRFVDSYLHTPHINITSQYIPPTHTYIHICLYFCIYYDLARTKINELHASLALSHLLLLLLLHRNQTVARLFK